VAQGLQRDFDRLTEENKNLKDELEKWRAYYATSRQAQPERLPAPAPQPAAPVQTVVRVEQSPRAGQLVQPLVMIREPAAAPSNAASPTRPATTGTAARTHTVKSGDTPAAIARKYGLRVDALMAANPNLDARRLQIGQVLAIPG